jgi:hypothetical protein
MSVNEIMPKLCHKFFCEKCDYGTSKKSSYDNHLISSKHKKSMIVNEIMQNYAANIHVKNVIKHIKTTRDYGDINKNVQLILILIQIRIRI